MRRLRVLALRVGDERHGVNRYGRDLVRALRRLDDTDVTEVAASDAGAAGPAAAAAVRAHGSQLVHLHLTEQLFGRDPEEAGQALSGLVDHVEVPVVSTLHDVPSPDLDHDRRRRPFYDVALARSERVVVSSRHEAGRLGAAAAVEVIPLLVAPLPRPAPGPGACGAVAVLGYLYPGKGHEAVVAACAAIPGPDGRPPFVALGTAAPRHPDLPAQLVSLGRAVGVPVQVTGWVDDADLPGHLARVVCPVVPGHGVSASASLATWIGAGRRPLVAAGPYARELAAWAPDHVRLYEPSGGPEALACELARALAEPATTWVPQLPASLAPERIAAAHHRLFTEVRR